MAFKDRLLPAKKDSGLFREDYTVWGSSVIKGEDGKYHMFSSSWPKTSTTSWLTDSTIVHSISDTPDGPFKYLGQALPPSGEGHWDSNMTHNPAIVKYKDGYALFYLGSSGYGTGDMEKDAPMYFSNKRIGVATSKSLFGPWTRYDKPILEPREGEWDACMTSNPAPYVNDDGSVVLIYKSCDIPPMFKKNTIMTHLHGVATAPSILGPYTVVTDNYLFHDYKVPFRTEDSCIWKEDGIYHMLAKVFPDHQEIFEGGGGGYHATSKDGINWTMDDEPVAYTRTIKWEDGTKTDFDRVERVQVLTDENGKATHLYFAVTNLKDDPSWEYKVAKSICVPLKAD